jgi:hypothetical protein
MKKIYMSPKMDVIELKHQQTLLAGSVGLGGTYNPETNGDVRAPEYEWYDWQF